ncbi:MAG: preprotein translocase subunit YajC [Ruminococcus sp.]
MNTTLTLLDTAQNQAGQAGQASAGGLFQSPIFMILIYVAIFAALYFFFIRPNSKKKKEEAEMRNSISVGDEVTTIGGIIGRVVAVKDEEDAIVIETGSDRVKMKMKKWCISTIDNQKEAPVTENTEKKGLFGFKKKKKEEE